MLIIIIKKKNCLHLPSFDNKIQNRIYQCRFLSVYHLLLYNQLQTYRHLLIHSLLQHRVNVLCFVLFELKKDKERERAR